MRLVCECVSVDEATASEKADFGGCVGDTRKWDEEG